MLAWPKRTRANLTLEGENDSANNLNAASMFQRVLGYVAYIVRKLNLNATI